jgi:hypothetical protein
MSSPPDSALSLAALLGSAPLSLLSDALLSDGLLGGELSLEGGEEDGGALSLEGGDEDGGALDDDGGELGGGVGGCGVVGLLALGQPLSSRQIAINPSTPGSA